MDTLAGIIEKYVAFEARVTSYSAKIYWSFCRVCSGDCCRPEICAEAVASPFLSHVRKHFVPEAIFDSTAGWLTEAGCKLPVGRPPVCHQFYCEAIFQNRATAEFRYAIKVLSNLVAYVGKNALGGRHIVELGSDSELRRVSFPRFEKHLDEAVTAFLYVCSIIDDDEAQRKPPAIIAKIGTPP